MTRNNPAIALLAVLMLAFSACGTDPPANSMTNNGSNTGGDCQPGERTCQDEETLATCARSTDGTPRVVTTTCLDTEICMNGDCVDRPRDCSDLCSPPETRCTTDGQVETCADHDGNGCAEFGGARGCDAGQICDPSDGLCKAPNCSDMCTQGDTACEDTLIATCSTGADGCLAFGSAKECPDGQSCSGGACVADSTCDDECTANQSVCGVDGESVRECRTDVDSDSCTELSDAVACSSGQVCRDGACVAANTCQDQCLANERVCVGNQIAVCETNSDGCLEFSAPTSCPQGQSCQNMGGGNVMCATVAVTGDVVINEVFYDAIGQDTRGSDGSPTFIELFGPPGLSLANFTIELVNGSGGAVYGTFQLPSDAKLDGNGFAVLVTDQADSFLSLALPFFTNVYPIMTGASTSNDVLQNGADNVRLLNGSGTEVDAVGYGDFSSATFAGEGSGAPDVLSGHSIGRDSDGTDTDDNSADFRAYYPTPSLPNSDLIINEIYFDQPGTDDGSETFVELMAPILGWEDIPLDGYVLRAINGFNGEDYILTGVLPGIDLAGYSLNDGTEPGYVVICNVDDVGNALLPRCSALYEGVDFQNGPDNFVLEYNGRVIDAVGYGSFGANETFVGEGTSVGFSTSNSGKSLSRWPIFDVSRDLDTDNNSADFFVVDPTPGQDNRLP